MSRKSSRRQRDKPQPVAIPVTRQSVNDAEQRGAVRIPDDGSARPMQRSPVPPKIPPKYLWWTVSVLSAMHFILAVTSAREKGPTYDEVLHLTCGYTYWQTDDYRMAQAAPPLPQLWAALPILAPPSRLPSLDSKSWHDTDLYAYGAQFFYGMGNDLAQMLARGRMMIALMSVMVGMAIFVWSRKLFGDLGGLVSLAAYTFCPNILANAQLVTADMTATAFFLFAVGSAWWMLHKLTPASLVCATLACGGLFLAKLTAVFFLPVFFALVIVRVFSNRPLEVSLWTLRLSAVSPISKARVLVVLLLCYAVSVYLVIWAGYGFRYNSFKHFSPGIDHMHLPFPGSPNQDPWEIQYEGRPRVKTVVELFRRHHLLPEAYLYSIALNAKTTSVRSAFLDGHYSMTGFRTFFPLAFLYKTPVPVIALLVCALLASVSRWRDAAVLQSQRYRAFWSAAFDGLYWTAPLWLLLVTYWIFAVTARINIGFRHILPTLPPLFVLMGAAAGMVTTKSTITRIIVPILAALLLIESLAIYPHYLAYFNWMAGGPVNGYRHLVDSSLDWGQDLPGLKKWLQEKVKGENVFVAYFGLAPPAYYGIQGYALPYDNMGYREPATIGLSKLTAGIYCVSATQLQQVYPPGLKEWTAQMESAYWKLRPVMREFEKLPLGDRRSLEAEMQRRGQAFADEFNLFQRLRFAKLCSFLRRRHPDDNVGYSILIYRLTDQDLHDALYVHRSSG